MSGRAIAGNGKGIPQRTKHVSLNVNGLQYDLELESRTTLAEALRENLGLTGTKVGCNRGECGSCTILIDGRPVYSCTVLAVESGNKRIQTIEGLARDEGLHPLQEAFVYHDGVQCGYCTPGIIMPLKALLDRRSDISIGDVRAAISGNYCRCGAYPAIEKAVMALAERQSVEGAR